MPGIAAVSAYNPRNYGMYSVDLAAGSFFGGLGLPHTPIITQSRRWIGHRRRTGRLCFEILRDVRELGRFDTVVYWGDFLNNPMWGQDDYAMREVRRHRVAGLRQGLENWRALYLELKRHHPSLRVLAVGGCFLGTDGDALATVRAPFQRFLETADLVAPRDERSFEILHALAPDARLAQGMDCAWLLPFPPRPGRSRDGHFVWSLGRTFRGDQRRLIRELSRLTGLRAVQVDWLNLHRPQFLAHWYFERMHRLIAGAEFVLADAYHLVINTLLRGVRAVCLHDPAAAESDGSCGDAKKAILLRQVGMPEMLVDVRQEDSLARRVQERLLAFGEADLDRALSRFQVRRDGFRRTLETALRPPAGEGTPQE
jgi:hypothetical protein